MFLKKHHSTFLVFFFYNVDAAATDGGDSFYFIYIIVGTGSCYIDLVVLEPWNSLKTRLALNSWKLYRPPDI